MPTLNTINDKWIALILALITITALLITNPQIGLTWDEPAYIAASESYAKWYGQVFTHPGTAFSREVIDQYWEINHEHPPIDKVLSGIVWSISRYVLNDLDAHRLGNIILVGALVAMLYLMVADTYGRTAGFLAIGALMTLPRFFFHAHLAALDVPATVAGFAVIFVFWKTKDKPGWKNTIWLGIVWGLAVATKVNAVFVMATLFIWVLVFRREKQLITRLVISSFIAFPIFILSWPWLYHEPFARMYAYIRFITVDHWLIGQFYLHRFYMPPPWHFPFVMVIATVPLTLFLGFAIGIFRTLKEKQHQSLGILFILNAIIPLLALSIGQSMVYDNDRLFMPTFVFIAALSGIGIAWTLKGISQWLKKIQRSSLSLPLSIVIVLLVFVPYISLVAPLYPHLLSYYSATVGGLPGATRIGLETTYWCETYNESLEYINANAKPGDTIWIDPWSHDVMVYYQLHGYLRDDVWISTPMPTESLLTPNASLRQLTFKQADFIILHNRQTSTAEGGASYPITAWLFDRQPDLQISHQGIPLIDIYNFKRGN